MHDEICLRIDGLLEDETDWVAAMATVVCELHHGFDHFHWTGFYRTTQPNLLKIGPYQGGHGCLEIPFDKGICGAAARTGETQDVPDVHVRPEHIACSSSTNSEVVVPVKDSSGAVVAVLDVDSDAPSLLVASVPVSTSSVSELVKPLKVSAKLVDEELP